MFLCLWPFVDLCVCLCLEHWHVLAEQMAYWSVQEWPAVFVSCNPPNLVSPEHIVWVTQVCACMCVWLKLELSVDCRKWKANAPCFSELCLSLEQMPRSSHIAWVDCGGAGCGFGCCKMLPAVMPNYYIRLKDWRDRGCLCVVCGLLWDIMPNQSQFRNSCHFLYVVWFSHCPTSLVDEWWVPSLVMSKREHRFWQIVLLYCQYLSHFSQANIQTPKQLFVFVNQTNQFTWKVVGYIFV